MSLSVEQILGLAETGGTLVALILLYMRLGALTKLIEKLIEKKTE